MNKLITAAALMAIFAISGFAQTPVPTATKPASPAAATPTAGGTGAEGKVATINMSLFRDGIQELKIKLDALNIELNPKQKEIESLQTQYEAIKKKITEQGPTANPQTKAQWAEEGTDLEKTLQRKYEDIEKFMQRRGGEVQGPIWDKVNTYMIKYCTQRGINVVIDAASALQSGSLLYFSPQTDITQDFMTEFNKAHPGGGVVAPKKD